VIVGRDVRVSGPSLQKSAIQGLLDMGVKVIDLGEISTEMLYFASGYLEGVDGGFAQTASHNPREWNGFKFVGKAGLPLTREDKLGEIYEQIKKEEKFTSETPGTLETIDLCDAYAEYLKKFVPQSLPKLKIVGNVNFGANGRFVDAALAKHLPDVEMVRLNWNPDGTFPKGTPDPLLPSNRIEIEARIQSESADFGVAWDADADRCFFYDEKGRAIPGYYINAMLITYFLSVEPGASFVIEPRQIWATEAAAEKGGGKTVVSRTGHGFIKAVMRSSGAIFGGENSGHFYYRDFWKCDNGIITFLTAMGIFGKKIADGGKVSEILDAYRVAFPASEEINFITDRAKEIIDGLQGRHPEATVTTIDGVSLETPTWRCNLRMSQNEPVLRLNVEAKTPAGLTEREADLIAYIEGFGAKIRDDH
jgi:phosphomannomutase